MGKNSTERIAYIDKKSKSKWNHELKRARKRRYLRAVKKGQIYRGAYLIKPKKKISYELDLPEVLCVKSNLGNINKLFSELETAIFIGRASKIIVNHTQLREVTPEAALLLISQLAIMSKFSPSTVFIPKGRSRSMEVEDLLSGIGYNDYFTYDVTSGNKRKSLLHNERIYIKHQTGYDVDGKVAADFVEEFAQALNFEEQRKERLTTSLGECMMNAVGWAYPEEAASRRWIPKRWWILGYTEKASGKAYFVFLDRGVGIPSTIPQRKLSEWGFRQFVDISRSDLVLKAFTEPRSNTGEDFRGRGLPLLRDYAESSSNGKLWVHSDSVQLTFEHIGEPRINTQAGSFDGTLLVWEVDSVHTEVEPFIES